MTHTEIIAELKSMNMWTDSTIDDVFDVADGADDLPPAGRYLDLITMLADMLQGDALTLEDLDVL